MPALDPKKIAGLQAIAAMQLAMAARVSEISDSVSNWLSIGIGAILGLLITNIDKLSAYISVDKIRTAAAIYIFSLVLTLIQKRLHVMVKSGSSGHLIASEHVQKIIESGLTFEDSKKQMLDASVPPYKWLIGWTYKKIQEAFANGDHTWVARKIAKVAQYQGIIVGIQTLLNVWIVLLVEKAIL